MTRILCAYGLVFLFVVLALPNVSLQEDINQDQDIDKYDDSITNESPRYCPSYCDRDNYYHEAVVCLHPPYCCDFGRFLACCHNSSIIVSEKIKDYHNCHSTWYTFWTAWWRVFVGLSVTIMLLIGLSAAVACTYKAAKKRTPSANRNRRCVAPTTVTTAIQYDQTHHQISGIHNLTYSSEAVFEGTNIPVVPPPYSEDAPPPYSGTEPEAAGITRPEENKHKY